MQAVRCSAWLGVGWLWWILIICVAGTVLLPVSPSLKLRYLTLHALIILNKVKIVCLPLTFRITRHLEILKVRCQIAVTRLQIWYLLIKRFVIHKFQGRAKTPNAPSSPTGTKEA